MTASSVGTSWRRPSRGPTASTTDAAAIILILNELSVGPLSLPPQVLSLPRPYSPLFPSLHLTPTHSEQQRHRGQHGPPQTGIPHPDPPVEPGLLNQLAEGPHSGQVAEEGPSERETLGSPL